MIMISLKNLVNSLKINLKKAFLSPNWLRVAEVRLMSWVGYSHYLNRDKNQIAFN